MGKVSWGRNYLMNRDDGTAMAQLRIRVLQPPGVSVACVAEHAYETIDALRDRDEKRDAERMSAAPHSSTARRSRRTRCHHS